jgi:hypothetical protein
VWDQIAALTLAEWVQIASAIGTVGAAVVAAIAAVAAFRSAKTAQEQLPEIQKQAEATNRQVLASQEQVEAANRQVLAAQEQVEIQRQIRIDGLQPQVWVDFQLVGYQERLLNLTVGNNGPSIARNVRVVVDPPIKPIEELRERFEIALSALNDGLPSLTPGRKLTWPIGQTFNVITDADSQRHSFMLTADGPFGPIDPIEFTIDLANLRGSMTL